MKKRVCTVCMAFAIAVSLAGCQNNSSANKKTETSGAEKEAAEYAEETEDVQEENGTVSLLVWGGEEDEELLQEIFESFKTKYAGQADFDITFVAESESSCKDTLMGNLEEGADVFAFADDQLSTLVAAGALEPVENAEEVKTGNLEEAVEAASVGDTLYAYPMTADNGYFLYYNKSYFSEEDVTSLDRMLEVAAANNKKITMDWSSAWYIYSFFGNTGLEVGLNEDGITNYCTWNGTDGKVKGIDVAQSMANIAVHPGFANLDNDGFMAGVKDGSVIAGINGVWNAVEVEKAWGKDYAATRLPVYNCGEGQVQMASFSGYKLVGVNAYSEHHSWASKLADWITNEENQSLRFEKRGQGPSNIKVAESDEVNASPAIAALLEQAEFSCLQRIAANYWDPVAEFASTLLQGNPQGEDLQSLLDKMVAGITAQ